MSELFLPILIGLATASVIAVLGFWVRDVRTRREAARPATPPTRVLAYGTTVDGWPAGHRGARRSRAIRLVAMVAVGGIIAAGGIAGALALDGQLADAGVAGSTSSPPVRTSDAEMPEPIRSALGRALETNERLRASREALVAELARPTLDPAGVAAVLRTVERQARSGGELAPEVAAWSSTTTLAGELRRFYAAVRVKAHDGVIAATSNPASARTAGDSIVRSLELLEGVDQQVVARAAELGAEIVPETSPAPSASGGS